jgi:hypothetical protein
MKIFINTKQIFSNFKPQNDGKKWGGGIREDYRPTL